MKLEEKEIDGLKKIAQNINFKEIKSEIKKAKNIRKKIIVIDKKIALLISEKRLKLKFQKVPQKKQIIDIDRKKVLLIFEKNNLFKDLDDAKKQIIDKFNKSIEIL